MKKKETQGKAKKVTIRDLASTRPGEAKDEDVKGGGGLVGGVVHGYRAG
jgi:hypothetical protein